MCYKVKCDKCGKDSWAGCGKHVPSVYQQIPEGQHCNCKDWPGVKLPSTSCGTCKDPKSSTGDDKAAAASDAAK